jgi:hypothetical protein
MKRSEMINQPFANGTVFRSASPIFPSVSNAQLFFDGIVKSTDFVIPAKSRAAGCEPGSRNV